MEDNTNSIAPQTENGEARPKKHLTIEEQLAQLEAKEKKAKAAEEKRKAKMAKLRSALLAQKREAFDKLLTENGILTEQELDAAMELHHTLVAWNIRTKSQLEKVLEEAEQANPTLMEELMAQNEQSGQFSHE